MKWYYQEHYPSVYLEGTKVLSKTKVSRISWTKGIDLGRGQISPDNKIMWLNIPKNASGSLGKLLYYKRKWLNANAFDLDPGETELFIIIRDPIERWKKCVLELLWHREQHKKEDHVRWATDINLLNPYKKYDIHFIRQVDFLVGFDNFKIHYFVMNEDFPNNINCFLGEEIPKVRTTEENAFKKEMLPWLEEQIDDEVLERLHGFYKLDIDLYRRLT